MDESLIPPTVLINESTLKAAWVCGCVNAACCEDSALGRLLLLRSSRRS